METITNHQHFAGWENCTTIDYGRLQLTLLPDAGGRIISLRFDEHELLYHDPKGAQERKKLLDPAKIGDEEVLSVKQSYGFPLWGGDKSWIAPQAVWLQQSPPLDLEAGCYTLSINPLSPPYVADVTMVSPICRETGLELQRRIAIDRDETIYLTQTITNYSDGELTRGIWNVTQFRKAGRCFLPTTRDLFRGYEDEGESKRVEDQLLRPVDGLKGHLGIDCRETLHFKVGGLVHAGWAAAILDLPEGARIGHLRRFPLSSEGELLHEAQVEIYNSPDRDYFELEVHHPAQRLKRGESQSVTHGWRFALLDHSLTEESWLREKSAAIWELLESNQ